MSRASQRNALLIQHCYSPFGTTQFEKTVKNRQKGPVWASKYPFGGPGGPQRAPGCQIWSQLPPFGQTHDNHTVWPCIGPVLAQNAPFGGIGSPPSDQIWSQMSPGPNSRGRIGTSDNFYVLMTTGPEAVLLYCMVLHVIELYSIVLYGIACYFLVLHGTA